MGQQPAREITFYYGRVAITNISSTENEEPCTGVEGEFASSLQSREIETATVALARSQRIGKIVTNPKLVSGHSSNNAEIWRDGLLQLQSLLNSAVFGAAITATIEDDIQDLWILKLKKTWIQIPQLRMSRERRQCANQQYQPNETCALSPINSIPHEPLRLLLYRRWWREGNRRRRSPADSGRRR